jgi:hypothetical protein
LVRPLSCKEFFIGSLRPHQVIKSKVHGTHSHTHGFYKNSRLRFLSKTSFSLSTLSLDIFRSLSKKALVLHGKKKESSSCKVFGW